jgi:hypothetical protein
VNQLIKELKKRYGRLFTKSVKKLIDILNRHSVIVPGVSFPSITYLIDKLDKSRATYYRSIKILQEIGFVKIHRVKGQPFFQIQPELNWDQIDEYFFGPSDETQNETQNETVDNSVDPIHSKTSIVWKTYRALLSFSASKINEYKYDWIGYNWLENEEDWIRRE